MENKELNHFLEFVGKDPSQLIFEDEITGIYNRRYLHHYLQFKIPCNSHEENPLSLIMLDVDHFKAINDTYGHQIGDEALIWVAKVLKEVAGEDGIPIRYAGDEFMILLPHREKDIALRMGERLLQRARLEPFRHKRVDGTLKITFSIGIASVPMNKKGRKDLIHKADTALYYAKKTGRDRLADVEDLDKEIVFAKTAINHLEEIKIVGRQKQLQQVAEVLKKFTQQQSQFLIIEGAAGMGKSVFLETIYHSLDQGKMFTIQTRGIPQEMFRPYYLMTNILISILNQLEDKGTGALETLNEEEIAYLSNILPYLGDKERAASNKSKKLQREGIFNTLIRFFIKAVNKRPLAIFIDDLHYIDEATLLLFRRLILQGRIPLFICGTSQEIIDLKKDDQMASLERFYETYSQEMDICKITLTPFTPQDIANHIKGIFPNVHLSKNTVKELMQITQGNPLFLSEILRKLVKDQKIVLIGHEWLVLPFEDGYLPKSLEEIVSQKITTLDEDSRQLLEHVSALGVNVPLSVLIGSTGKMEAQVLEFIDQAKDQGLISSEFQLNDDTINFLSKCILQITYGSIEDRRKQEMHEQIGNYQENLFKKNLLPSAATLAYHFKRSDDQKRTKKYEQFMAKWCSKIFNAQEALKYEGGGEEPEEFLDEEGPLDSACLEKVPNIIRYILNAVRNFKLYPKGSLSNINAVNQLKQEIDQILENTSIFNIVQRDQTLVVNNQEINITEFKSVAHNFFSFMNRFDLRSIGFCKCLTEQELEVLLDSFCSVKKEIVDPNFWQCFLAEHKDIKHIRLNQIRYTRIGDQNEHEMHVEPGKCEREAPGGLPYQLYVAEQELDQEESVQVLEIMRALLRTSRNIKLYPLESKAIADSIQQLMRALQSILTKYPVLSLARVNNSLLVNGKKIDISVFGTLVTSFLKFFETFAINSLSFLQHITLQELQTFIESLGQFPNEPVKKDFWEHFCKDRKLSGILFNRHLYEILDGIQGNGSRENSGEDLYKEGEVKTLTEDPFDIFLKEIQGRLTDLLIKNNQKKLQKTLKQLFQGFHDRVPYGRKKVIAFCKSMLENLTLAARCGLSELMADQVIDIFSEEKDPYISMEIASLLKHMVNSFIQFAEYQSASKLLFHLQKYYRQLNEVKDKHAPLLSEAMDIKLDPTTQRLIMDDLKSSDLSRQKDTTQLLGILGEAAIPLLIDIIKREEDYRARRIASTLMEELSPEAGKLLKQELLQEIDAEERVRILEILENLNTDLKDDLVFVLGDSNPKVRKAAFQLAERLNDQYVVELLLDYAKNKETSLAMAAIKCLGKLKIQAVGEKILSLLNSTKEEERLIAICRALGQVGDPASIEPLAKILAPKPFFSFQKKPSPQVRTAAAYALSQISHTKGSEVLASFVQDPEPGIRQIAKTAIEKAKSSSSKSG